MKRICAFLILFAVFVAVFTLQAAAETNLVAQTCDPQTAGVAENRYWNSLRNQLPLGDDGVSVFARQCRVAAGASSSEVLPAAYDARNNGISTPIYSQGITSACWAISAIDAISMNLQMQSVAVADLSVAHLVWFAHRSLLLSSERDAGDGTLVADPFFHGGNWLDAVATLSRWSGPTTSASFPFLPNDPQTMGNYSEDFRRQHDAYLTAASCLYSKKADEPAVLTADIITAIKKEIIKQGAVQTSFYFDFSNFNDSENGTAYYQSSEYTTNHAVLMIGWDDSYSKNNFNAVCRPSADGAWLCKNSWGGSWGDDGYFWISYEDTSYNQVVIYRATAEPLYEYNYQYDGFGFHGRLYTDDYVSYGNVFTADEDCEIASIGTWFLQDNTDYTIKVFRLGQDSNIPIADTVAASVSGTKTYYGYYVIDLRAPVFVSKGQKFSVMVELAADESCPNVNIPVENANASDYVSFSQVGQSYVQIERDGKWYDTSTEGLNNVCVKALTLHEHADADGDFRCDECNESIDRSFEFFMRRIIAFLMAILANLDTILNQQGVL